jgi:DNA processing protein
VSLESLRTYRSRYSPDRVRRALDIQLEQGITAISPEHPWWPPRLSDLGERAPTTLWVKGSLHQASGTQGVAIVGSSRPTRSGRQAAIACSEGALEKGLTILSGGTRGISTDAHRRAVNGGGISVAVVAGGLESVLTHLTTGPSLVVSCSVGRWSQKFPQPWHQQLEGYWLAIEW